MSPPGADRPPRLAAWILWRLAPPSVRDHLLGDLDQEFSMRVRRAGRRGPAVRWYVGQAVRSLPHLFRERLAARAGGAAGWSPADVRHAARSLRRSPTFTVVAVATLAVGIGANTIVFTFVHGALVEPLPLPEPGRLYIVQQTRPGSVPSRWLSIPDYRDIRESAAAFQDVAAVTPDAFIVQGAGEPQYVDGAEASTNYFDVLGVRPIAGRTFGPQDDEAARVVVTEGFWERSYGRDPAALGSLVDVDGFPREIVGVVTDDADVLGGMELFVPIRTSIAGWRESRGTDWVWAVGRLAPGVGPRAALAELDELGTRLAEAFPETNVEQGFTALHLQEQLTGSFRAPLLVLMAAVGLVLIIVCVNLAGLLLARGLARRREVATRIALGVGRGRLFGQLLTESLLLALSGGALGAAMAVYGVPVVRRTLAGEAPGLAERGVDGPVLLFAGALCVGATLLFGLAPAWGVIRGDVGEALAGRTRGTDRRHLLARHGLVVGQMALALVLLVGSSLLLKSFARLYAVDLGIRTEGVVTARLPLVDAAFPGNVDRTRHYERVLDLVRRAPGIEEAAMVNALPLRDSGPTFSFATAEATRVPEQDRLAGFRAVMGDYFDVMGIEVLAGRSFTPDELAGEVPAVVVDRAFEAAFFPGGALGKEIEALDELRRIVGVVASTPGTSPRVAPTPKMYVPLTPDVRQTMAIVARGPLSGAEALATLRSAIRSADARQTVQSLLPMDAYRSRSVAQERIVLGVLGAMGVVALLLAALGTYGILAYVVSQRTQEIGVRIALGASARSVRRMVLASGARMVAVGLLVGVGLAAVGARFLEDLLFEVPPLDPASFAWAALLLVSTALVASYVPALRATRTSTVEALRTE